MFYSYFLLRYTNWHDSCFVTLMNTQNTTPNELAVRDGLARILGSTTFAKSRRSSDFLRYVVEETLAGRQQRIKGLSIAVDVFGRQEDFDPHSDPLVRVEALRLRNRLGRYYETEGEQDPIRISLHKGSYVPAFAMAQLTGDAPASSSTVSGNSTRLTTFAAGLLLVAAAFAATTGLWLGDSVLLRSARIAFADETSESESLAAPQRLPQLILLPTAGPADDASTQRFAQGLLAEINLALVPSGTIAVIDPSIAGNFELPLAKPRQDDDLNFLLRSSARASDTALRVAFHLVDASSGRQSWTQQFEVDTAQDLFGEQQRIAQQLAQILQSPLGPIFSEAGIELLGAYQSTDRVLR